MEFKIWCFQSSNSGFMCLKSMCEVFVTLLSFVKTTSTFLPQKNQCSWLRNQWSYGNFVIIWAWFCSLRLWFGWNIIQLTCFTVKRNLQCSLVYTIKQQKCFVNSYKKIVLYPTYREWREIQENRENDWFDDKRTKK